MNLFLQICLFTFVKIFWYRVKLKRTYLQRSLTVKDKMQTSNNIFSTFLPFPFTTARARTLSTGKSGESARPNKKCCSLLEQYHRMGSPRSSQEFFRAHTHKHTNVRTHPLPLWHTHTYSHTIASTSHTLPPRLPLFLSSTRRSQAALLCCSPDCIQTVQFHSALLPSAPR